MTQPTSPQTVPETRPATSGQPGPQVPPAAGDGHQVVATYRTYVEAQAAVDSLSDRGFAVSSVQIVGRGLHSVEQVTGRLTNGRAAVAGLASGLMWGLFVGLLFGILVPGVLWFSAMLWSLVLGAVFGALSGWLGHLATGGRRDFASVQTLQADEYSLLVEAPLAAQAASMLGR